jgi:putative sigma-54 modulation protein
MKVNVQSIHFNADQKLLDFIQDKVDKLVHFYDHILGGEVFLRLDKSDNTQNKVVQIHITVPGQDLHSRQQCRTFEEATDLAVEALSKQIIKHKERQRGE